MSDTKTLGRPREFDEEVALAGILDAFWKQGFAGTSMSDLVDATDLRKGSLYAAFGDKHAMYLKALALYEDTVVDSAVALLTGPGTPLERLDGFLSLPVTAITQAKDRRGCFLCNASVDQAMLDPDTERAVKAGFRRLARGLETALSDLAGREKRSGDVKAQAQHLLSVYFGLRVLAKGGQSAKVLTDAKRAALDSLSSIA